jgi:hypothetical protein
MKYQIELLDENNPDRFEIENAKSDIQIFEIAEEYKNEGYTILNIFQINDDYETIRQVY